MWTVCRWALICLTLFCISSSVVGESRKESPSTLCFYMWASALCIRSTIIPPLLTDPQQFHYCTDSNPGTGADDAFVLKRGVWRNATWPSHSRPAIAASERHFQICFSPLTFWPLVCLPTLCLPSPFLCTKPWVIYFGILECLSNVYLDAGSSLISRRCLSRSILFIAVVCMSRFV